MACAGSTKNNAGWTKQIEILYEFGFGPDDDDSLYHTLDQQRSLNKLMESLDINSHEIPEALEAHAHERNNRILAAD